MKNDWLTIPDAPNYEINSDLVCRNKITQKILTPQRIKRAKGSALYYSLNGYGVNIWRTGKSLRRQAAASQGTFALIPSLGNRYEINKKGVVRNARTKIILKVDNTRHHQAYFKDGHGRCFARSIADLLWEVHGIIRPRKFKPIPVLIDDGKQKFFFATMTACAKFLAPKLFYKWQTLANYMQHFRKPQIGEWTVTYLVSEDRALADNIPWRSHALASLARRQAKLDKSAGLTC